MTLHIVCPKPFLIEHVNRRVVCLLPASTAELEWNVRNIWWLCGLCPLTLHSFWTAKACVENQIVIFKSSAGKGSMAKHYRECSSSGKDFPA